MEDQKGKPSTFLMPLVFCKFSNDPKPKDMPQNLFINQLIFQNAIEMFMSVQTAICSFNITSIP